MADHDARPRSNTGKQSIARATGQTTAHATCGLHSARVEAFKADAKAAMETRLRQMQADIEAKLHTQWTKSGEQVGFACR